jgi:hypothetical protein
LTALDTVQVLYVRRERDYPICLRHWPLVNCKVLTPTQPLEPYLDPHVYLVIIPLVLSRYGRTCCSHSPHYYTLNADFSQTREPRKTPRYGVGDEGLSSFLPCSQSAYRERHVPRFRTWLHGNTPSTSTNMSTVSHLRSVHLPPSSPLSPSQRGRWVLLMFGSTPN